MISARMVIIVVRDKQRGGNSGEGKTYHKSPPPKRFWTPPLMIRFPPPFVHAMSFSLEETGTRPDKSHFLRPPKLVLEGVLYGTFSPPKIARYVLPPPLRIPNLGKSKGNGGATTKGNEQSRPRKNPRASKRTSRRAFLWEFLE